MPPLPETWNLPFQPSIGSQTSKLTAGSVTATTRQTAGMSSGSPPVGARAPDATVTALVMVVAGSASPVRVSHGAEAAGEAVSSAATAATATTAARGANRDGRVSGMVDSSWPGGRRPLQAPSTVDSGPVCR